MTTFAARYNDGRTAASQIASVQLDTAELRIRDATGATLAQWPLGEIHLVDRAASGRPMVLRRGHSADARLTVRDDAVRPALLAACPNLGIIAVRQSLQWRAVAMWSVPALAAVAFILFMAIPYAASAIARAMPPRIEQSFGEAAVEQIVNLLARETNRDGQDVACRSLAGDAALARLSARLSANADAPMPITVHVLDLPIVNAFALPGGQILLFDGLLEFVQAPEELAGVLAHEVAHVVYRHPVELWLRNAGTAALIGLLVGDVAGGTVLAGMGQIFVNARYSQDAERHADAMGVELLGAADIDAHPLADFFDRLATGEGAFASQFSLLLTHPPTPERSAAIRALPADGAAAMSESEWRALRGICG